MIKPAKRKPGKKVQAKRKSQKKQFDPWTLPGMEVIKFLAVEMPEGSELRVRLRDGALLGTPEIAPDEPQDEWLEVCREIAMMMYRAYWKYKLKKGAPPDEI